MTHVIVVKSLLAAMVVGLPLVSLTLVWVLGLSVGNTLKDTNVARILATTLMAVLAGLCVAGGAAAIVYSHGVYEWFPRQQYLWLVIPWGALLFISFICGEARWGVTRLCRCIGVGVCEIADECCD